jgi:hypothetical protein
MSPHHVFHSPAKFIFAAFSLSILLISCQKDPVSTVDCTGIAVSYSTDIKSILDVSCATSGCHNASAHQAGVDLSTYNGARNVSSQDRFLGSIQHKKGYNPMPQNSSQLSQDKIDLITCWVQNGAVE